MFRFFQPEKTNDAHYTVLMNDPIRLRRIYRMHTVI